MAKSDVRNDRRRGPTPFALRAPYIGPLLKRDSKQHNINMTSELIFPSRLSKQWGPPYILEIEGTVMFVYF